MLRLAATPLWECLERLPPSTGPVGLQPGLPETETNLPLDGPQFLADVSTHTDGAFGRYQSDSSVRGQSAACSRSGLRKCIFASACAVRRSWRSRHLSRSVCASYARSRPAGEVVGEVARLHSRQGGRLRAFDRPSRGRPRAAACGGGTFVGRRGHREWAPLQPCTVARRQLGRGGREALRH